MQIARVMGAGLVLMACMATAHAETVFLQVKNAVVPEVEAHKPEPEVVNVTLAPEGQRSLAAFTRDRVGRIIYLRVDGVLMTSATLQSPLTGNSLQLSPGLTGFTKMSAKDIARSLNSGGKLELSDDKQATTTGT